jgi:ceramide glucosyltransferase
MVGEVLGKRVAVARQPVENVSARRSVREFAARYRRWAVLQRQLVGPVAYASQVLLNPVLLASAAAALDRSPGTIASLAGVCAAKAALDGMVARALRPGGFRLGQLALVPLKDIVVASAWAHALVRREVEWRGNRLRVGTGSRVERLVDPDHELEGDERVASA